MIKIIIKINDGCVVCYFGHEFTIRFLLFFFLFAQSKPCYENGNSNDTTDRL